MISAADLTAKADDSQVDLAWDILDDADIEFTPGQAGWFNAAISSDRAARVAFSTAPGPGAYFCNCAYFHKHGPRPCGHVIAAITTAEERGLLPADDADARPAPKGAAKGAKKSPKKARPAPPADWKKQFAAVRSALAGDYYDDDFDFAPRSRGPAWPAGRELLYVLDVAGTLEGRGVVVETCYRERKKNGEWGKITPVPLTARLVGELPEADREIVSMLVGAPSRGSAYHFYDYDTTARRTLSEYSAKVLLPRMCRTGRCLIRHADRAAVEMARRGLTPRAADLLPPLPLEWDEGGPWEFWLDLTRDEAKKQYLVTGQLARGEERMPLSKPILVVAGGFVFTHTTGEGGTLRQFVAPMEDFGAFPLANVLRGKGVLHVPFAQADEFLSELHRLPRVPKVRAPEELRVDEVTVPMRPRLRLRAPQREDAPRSSYGSTPSEKLVGELGFDYGGQVIPVDASERGVFVAAGGDGGAAGPRRLILRDRPAESAALARLRALGFKLDYSDYTKATVARLAPKSLPAVVRALVADGWHVEADGKLYRQPGEFKLEVTSGIDWFDLQANVDFGGQTASLPRLLEALRKGENLVRLDDGTYGMLPEDWLKKYGALAGVGAAEGDTLRFTRTQAGLLDALLASQPQVTVDETFARTRAALADFKGVRPLDAPPTFTGELRPYQREALGWFDFLRQFGFGGCLADDMGLGKTVQVLALLDSRRQRAGEGEGRPEKKSPTLVVVPRSLVFNWKQESARFAPALRVLDHSTPARRKTGEHFGEFDVVLTTYGTLRHDAAYMKDVAFDYVVLDEAQAIKNAASESAKAARLVRGTHRLALSGTPVQNHLGDLWSLFDFLNPGLLGSVNAFAGASAALRAPDPETRTLLSRGLRPFILRRTKEQVAKDLPEKLEQTLYCELEAPQRKLYDELRDHYRASLLKAVETVGINRAKIQILEALLRLRQAACHPGLIDKKRAGGASAKLDTLLPRLREAAEEGQKALVFSQFTSFLALVRKALDAEGIEYEYLDGKTRDRQARVDRFQNDPKLKLFLISLKAGGLGLNLTAADYVFLLDPWWNPAVEAQAIDRSHRIGQTRQVFACRLIARDTVEEKVLALQQTKRDLADAIINADNSLIRGLKRDDLELLLS